MAGRRWSKEELELLEDLTEKYPLDTVARKLGRTQNAVFLKRQRLGIGGYRDNTDMLTRNTLSQILGVENRTIQYWERKGIKAIRKRPYVMYRHQDIIKYLRDHPDEEIKEPVTKKGDIWKLGRHRLMCGDSTSQEDMAVLMSGEMADLVVTDPPYNVNYGDKAEMLDEYLPSNQK